MVIQNNVSSIPYNTFGVDVQIGTLIKVEDKSALAAIVLREDTLGFKVIGGGSNILLTGDIDVPLVQVDIKGIEIILEKDTYVLAAVGAGEIWHEVVLWAVSQGYGGIENLALIPGRAGAAPIQNIGAYGVELKDCIHSVKAIHKEDGQEYVFHNQECGFGYRNSNFKNQWKDKFVITQLILKLSKVGHHELNTSYGAINNHLNALKRKATIDDVAQAVIEIRQSKLPDPRKIGNAGSFFKNPLVSQAVFEEVKKQYAEVPHYPQESGLIKLPAGWLIEKCGWKGKQVGNAGVYEKQALVLVNKGQAKGSELAQLSLEIQASVLDKFGIKIEREVNIW